ncbi:MAG: lipocalin-like domain-containing protein [Muribaculaceae bacterium]|nr:lipocalin-like domain-containing protein [Muribaculaceae bacterium]
MKTIKIIFCLLVIFIILPSCTRNDGNIGDYFGRWKLEKITLDGDVRVYKYNNIFWSFQSSIIEMDEVNELYHSKISHYGSWFVEDDSLVLDFGHCDNDSEPGKNEYAPISGMFLENGINMLDVILLSGSEMHLRYDKGEYVVDYYLIKWN